MPRYMIEDTPEGFKISLMEHAGFHEDLYSPKHSIILRGSHNPIADAFGHVEQAWWVARHRE